MRRLNLLFNHHTFEIVVKGAWLIHFCLSFHLYRNPIDPEWSFSYIGYRHYHIHFEQVPLSPSRNH